MLSIPDEEIGGARVRRIFSMNGRHMRAGETLTPEQVRALPPANRRALIDSQYLDVWPKPSVIPDFERHIVSNGFGKFSVIVGHKLNEHPLTKEEAERLAKGE